MNTPAHLIFGAAVFGRPGNNSVTWAAILGALSPDVSLYLMVTWSIFISGIEPSVVFGNYYYSVAWQQVFAVDNSFVLWAIVLGLAFWSKRPALTAFASAGLLHLAFDFPMHNHDARMHFWPLSDWRFISPISYWDSRYHAGIVSTVEFSLALLLAVTMLVRYPKWPIRTFLVLAVIGEMLAVGAFRVIF